MQQHRERCIELLDAANILCDENRELIQNHTEPQLLSALLEDLHRVGILNAGWFNYFVHTRGIVLTLWRARIYELFRDGILNEENLELYMRTIPFVGDLIEELDRPEIRERAHGEADEPLRNLPVDIDQEIPINQQVVNQTQSTHTASVHQSVSKSAQDLMTMYHDIFSLDKGIEEIKDFVKSLSLSPKHTAAQNAMTRLTSLDYVFTDPKSDVSTRQLLVLFWRAIHDDKNRQGSLEDAKKQFIDALYEIQRGYNLDERGVDNNQGDSFICTAGTFNKLIEKLQGIHPAATVLFITKETANLKFGIVVKEEIIS